MKLFPDFLFPRRLASWPSVGTQILNIFIGQCTCTKFLNSQQGLIQIIQWSRDNFSRINLGSSINMHYLYLLKLMDQVAAKTYLGIAIQEVVKQLGLEKRAKKIYETFFEAFSSNYEAFKNTCHEPSKADGALCEHFQYPIGDKETLQYYLAYGEMSFSMTSLRHMSYLKNTNQAMLQGFSTNEGVKVKSSKRVRRNRNDGEGAYGRKRRNG